MIEQYINQIIIKESLEIQKEFLRDMWKIVYNTDEVVITKCIGMNNCEDITYKIIDLEKPHIDLLLGEMIKKDRDFVAKREEFKKKLYDKVD